MSSATSGFPRVFALRGARGAITLHASGLRHPRSPAFLGDAFTAYEDITHHSVSSRGLRLATRHSVYAYPRSWFEDPSGPDQLARELMERIEALPRGRAQLDRMWEVEKRAARSQHARVAPALAALCVAVYAAQELVGGERLFMAGMLNTYLVRAGQVWRLLSANLLHANLAHLLLNALGLAVIGALVERALGPWRTGLLAAASGLGGMAAGLFFQYEMAVGASGVVFGLVGALLWLELACTRDLPVSWRVPRGLLVAAVAGDLLISVLIPQVATAAHLGGLAAGALACALLAPGALAGRPVALGVRAVDVALLFAVGMSLSSVVTVALRKGSPLGPLAGSLVGRKDVPADTLNTFAWLIATDPGSRPDDLKLAVRLAERAVDETHRRDPNVLDTLAEAQFAAGKPQAAVRTIEEAIALAPGEPYFVEQRRRFTGERDRNDRPAPPYPWIRPHPEKPEPMPVPDDGQGVQVRATLPAPAKS